MSDKPANRDESNFERGIDNTDAFLTIRPGCFAKMSDGRRFMPGDEVDHTDPLYQEIAHKCVFARRSVMKAIKKLQKDTEKKRSKE